MSDYIGTFLAANEARMHQLETIRYPVLSQAVADSNFPPGKEY